MKKLLLVYLFTHTIIGYAKFKLCPIFSEDMVLQREKPINIWGTANPGEEISIKFKNKKISAITLPDSSWKVNLGTHPAGGPYDLLVQSIENQQYFENIMIGDVWLCGGQSNMDFTLNMLGTYDSLIKNTVNKNIRHVKINYIRSEMPLNNVNIKKNWSSVSPENTGDFSATAYFFGSEIARTQKIPIGLISNNWGGSPIEVWMDDNYIKKFPEIQSAYIMKDSIIQKQEMRKKLLPEWVKKSILLDSLSSIYEGKIDNIDYTNWKKNKLPFDFSNVGLENFDGVMWVVKEIDIPQNFITEGMKINLGYIDDADHTYFNGIKIGGMFNPTDKRVYDIPKELVIAGKNKLVVRMVDYGWGGSISSDDKNLSLENNIGVKIKLEGPIWYKNGYDITKIEGYINRNWNYEAGWKPNILFNGMINPIKDLPIKGVIWYQGESNASRAYQYRKLFPALINNWRETFKQPNLPFLFVQIANFLAPDTVPKHDSWPELREAQTFALNLPYTGMAVAIDVGDAIDIHPKDKKTVGERLAAHAKKIVYNNKEIASGPTYASQKIEGNKIRITFKYIGKGIIFKGDMPHEFAIAGEDKKYYYANAKIEGNTIVVWSKKVSKPLTVRYAWANNPSKANMYNINGFPMVPFRTDEWKGVTYGITKID